MPQSVQIVKLGDWAGNQCSRRIEELARFGEIVHQALPQDRKEHFQVKK